MLLIYPAVRATHPPARWVLAYHASKAGEGGGAPYGFAYLDCACERAFIAVTFFVVLSGFTTHRACSRLLVLTPRGGALGVRARTYAHYAFRRVDRVV